MSPPHSSPVGARGPRDPLSRRNVAVVSHARYVLTVTAAPASRVKAAVSKAAWRHWPLNLENGVTWAICANFGLPRPLCSRLRPDVRDRQRRHARLNRFTRTYQICHCNPNLSPGREGLGIDHSHIKAARLQHNHCVLRLPSRYRRCTLKRVPF